VCTVGAPTQSAVFCNLSGVWIKFICHGELCGDFAWLCLAVCKHGDQCRCILDHVWIGGHEVVLHLALTLLVGTVRSSVSSGMRHGPLGS